MQSNFDATDEIQRQMNEEASRLRGNLNYGLGQDPDQYAKDMATARKIQAPIDVLQDPKYRKGLEDMAKHIGTTPEEILGRSTKIAGFIAESPDHAAVAHDDLPTLQEIEDAAKARPAGLSDTQWKAVYDHRVELIRQNAGKTEAGHIGNTLALGALNPLVGWGETLAAVPSVAGSAVREVANFLTGPQSFDTTARNIVETVKDPYRPGTTGESIKHGAEWIRNQWQTTVKQGFQEQLIDPETKKPFVNPDFSAWTGRQSADALLSIPGMMALFYATGKVNPTAGPALASATAGREKYQQARAAGDDAGMALERGLITAGLNWGLMTALPHSVQTRTATGAALQAGGRGVTLGLGMTAAENMADNLIHGDQNPWYKGASHNLVSFIGFELAPVLPRLIDAAATSKLKARSPEVFQTGVERVLEQSGVEKLLIPADEFHSFLLLQGVVDPSAEAERLGVRNYEQARANGTDVVIPTADFLAKLSPEQQRSLIPDIKLTPDQVFTPRQKAEWIKGGGPERVKALLSQELTPEESSSTDYKTVFEEARRRFVAAGERPEVADDYATLQANVYTNLARESGHTAAELFRLYDPKVVLGEVPTTLRSGGADVRTDASRSGPTRDQIGTLSQPGVDEAGGQFPRNGRRLPQDSPDPGQYERDQASSTTRTDPTGNPELRGFNGEFGGVDIGFDATSSNLIVRPAGLEETRLFHPDSPQIHLRVSNKGDSVIVSSTEGDFRGYGFNATDLMVKGLAVLREARPEVQWVYGELIGGEPIQAWRARFPSTRFGPQKALDKPVRVGELFPYAPNPDEIVTHTRSVVTNIDDIISGARVSDAEYNRRLTELGLKPRREVVPNGEGQGQERWQGLLGGQGGPDGSPDLLRQPGEAKPPRGWFRVLPDGTYEIGKTKIGDLSTFVHEPAHSYLYMLRDLAALPTASGSLKGDFAKTLKWLGAGTWEDVVADYQKHEAAGTVKDSMLEKWARGNEAYIREGKAPTEGLRGVFQRFSVWLGSIYRKASSLGVELDPEIRGVMDRLYAGDRAVDEAQKIVDVRPLFTSAEMMGWTQAEYDLYAGKAADAVSSAHAAVNERLQREYQRERETWWKDETANVRAGVLEEIDADPTYRAISILKDGELPVVGEDGAETRVPIKLNRQAIIDQFGEETLKKLPHGLRDHKGAGTMDAEAAAELLGFDSGHALIDAITKAEPKNDLVDRLTTERMKEKHGDLQTAGLDSVSVEALHNKAREEMLHAELQALRKKERELKPGRELQRKIDEASSESERQAAQDAWDAYQKDQKAIAAEGRQQARAATEVPPTASFREAARDFVSEQTPRDLDPYSYLLASRREAKRAFDAMAKDDYSTAADAKQKELLNHHMYLEATKAKVEAAKIFEYGRKGQTPDFQGKLGLAGREFQDQWNALAERVEFRKVTDTELDTRTVLRGLGEWQKEFEEDGAHIDPILLAGGPPRNWREVPMSELRAVRDGLKNIETVAKAQLGAILDGIKLDLEREAGLLDTAARASLGSKPVPRQGTKLSLLERAQTKLQGFNSYMQKLEWAIDQLDGGDINGPARRNIKAPIDNASAREKEMGHEVKLKLMEVFKDRTQQERSHEFDGIGVRFPGMDRDLNRMQLFSWALNLGTAENRKVATLGEGLIAEDGTLRPEFEQALSKLTSAEARRLQGVWDALESMRPAIIEKERRTTGIEPKWKEVTPLTFKTADDEVVNLQGGYYPLKADPNIDNVGRRQVDPANMVGKYGLPKVSDSHTQAVTGATYRLLLDYPTVLGQHVPAVIKNVTMGEAIKYVSKFITRDDVSATLKETLGLEKETEFEPWLKAVAGNGMDNDQGGPVMRWLMGRRMGMVTARLGGNLTSYLVQLGDSTKLLANESASYLTKELPQAYLDIRRDPKGVIEDIRRLSPNEMRFREENFNREIRDLLTSKDILDESKQRVTEFLMTGFQVMDRLQTFPAWLAKYREGMGAHGDEGQAVREADRLIARTFQAGEARNLSRVMREQGLMKMFTTFQGDANTWYGILSSAFESKNVKRISVGLMAVIAEQMLSSVIRGRIPSDEDKLAGWTLGNVMSALFNPFGVFGDFADTAFKSFTGQYAKFNNPTLDAIEKLFLNVPKSIKAHHEGRKDAEGLALDVVEAAGLWAGIPGTGQLIKSWKYQHGLRTGTQPAPSSTAAEVAHTLLGPPPKEK